VTADIWVDACIRAFRSALENAYLLFTNMVKLKVVLCRNSEFNNFLTWFCILVKFGFPSGVSLIKSKYYAILVHSLCGENSIFMLKTNKYLVSLYKIYLPHAQPSPRLASVHVLLHFLSVFLKDF
jgi:hypothetical protein